MRLRYDVLNLQIDNLRSLERNHGARERGNSQQQGKVTRQSLHELLERSTLYFGHVMDVLQFAATKAKEGKTTLRQAQAAVEILRFIG